MAAKLNRKINNAELPLTSIIIPMRNAEAYIANCLRAILQDKSSNIEVIVVDDHSTDRSRSIVSSIKDHRVRLIDGPGTGISDCLNEGLSAAAGSVIMRCDADDLYPKHRIQQQIKWLSNHPEFDAVCGSFGTIDAKGKLISEMECGREHADITNDLKAGQTRTHLCTFAIRSYLVRKLGGFRNSFTTGEDIDFQLRLGEAGRIAYVPLCWYQYRIHPASITHTQSEGDRLFFQNLSRTLQNQRRSGGSDDLETELTLALPPPSLVPTSAGRHIQGLLLGRAWREHASGMRYQAIISGARAVAAAPASIEAWKSFFALIIKSTPGAKN